jgi:hypothetical protein
VSRHRFEVATRADDAQLRRILAETPMPGAIALSFRREPSYFEAAVVDGEFHQTMIARNREGVRIAGLASRSVRERYVNGRVTPIGYLAGLRLAPEYRGGSLLASGYGFLRQLHSDQRARLYLTTIAEGNTAALSALTLGRAGLPRYHFAGMYHTAVIPLGRRKANGLGAQSSVEIRETELLDLPELIRFLHTAGPARQFFPRYDGRDFFRADGTFRDLKPADLLLAFRQGRIVGTLAAWDQSHFRQTIVEAYQTSLRWTRPLYNAWASLRGVPPLPKPGGEFRFLTAALPLVMEGDPLVFDALLRAVLQRAAAGAHQFFLIGMHERDPLLKVVKAHQSTYYLTRLYHVCWEDGELLLRELDERSPYLELGCL